jgi:methionyl-tRNA formyltransferase
VKIIFAGTPETAVPSLAALVGAGNEVVLVITREDAPMGRKRVLTPSPVAVWAQEHDLNVLKANRLGDDEVVRISESGANLGVVVAFGVILNQQALESLARGWINLHFSELPAWRGAAPVQRSIMAGDTQTATSVFELVAALDAGPILGAEQCSIDADDTAEILLERLSRTGAQQLVRIVEQLEAGHAHAHDQQGEPTYAAKLSQEDGAFRADESGPQTYNRFRGVTSEPGFFFFDADQRIKVLEARLSAARLEPGELIVKDSRVYLGTQSLALELRRVHPAGKVAMNAADWMRGRASRKA